MTRLLTTGYETGDINEMGTLTSGGSTMSVVNTAPVPRAGAYCLKSAPTTTAFGGPTYKTLALPAAKTEAWARFAFLTHALPGMEITIAQWNDAGAVAQLSISYSGVDGLIRLNRGTGTLITAASTAFGQDTWVVIDWRIQILTATTGASEVWVNGNRVINFSGDVAATTTLNVQTLSLGHTSTSGTSASGAYMAWDDIAVNDTAGTLNNGRIGDGRVVLLVPNGAGSSTQLTRGGTDTGANYSQVSELPPSMAQYVGSPTVGQRDLYGLANLPVAVSSINVVEILALAQNSDAGAGSIGLTLKSGATINEATAIGLGTSAVYVTSRWETDPNTTAAWTAGAIDALEVGATIR